MLLKDYNKIKFACLFIAMQLVLFVNLKSEISFLFFF
jgi:hypothetical protein